MDKIGKIEISVTITVGNLELTPDNYDIKEIISMLENAENLLYPTNKKDRPTISYSIENGSVRHIFKTSIQYIIGFNAIIGQVQQSKSIDFLDNSTANAFENIQEMAEKRDYTFSIKTSLDNTNEIIVDQNSMFKRSESVWGDAEFYFYGKVTNAGGKDKANIHIYIDELGTVRMQTPISFLEKYEENLLYKTLGIKALGKQHSETGEIDTSSLKFVELIDYQQKYDENYLSNLREKAKRSWLSNINADVWLKELRGGYDV